MKKKKLETQIIVFDGEDCCCRTIQNCVRDFQNFGDTRITYTGVMSSPEIVRCETCGDKVELDEKRMKQIAKYNAEQDVDFLIRKKQLIEEEIKMLEDKKKIIEQKFKQLIDFSNKFLKDKAETMEDYIEENYTDPDYDYWD